MQTVAQSFLVLDLTHSGTQLGLTTPRPPPPSPGLPTLNPGRRAGARHGHGQPPMMMGQSWRCMPRTAHDQAVKTSERFDRLETERLIMRRWQESDRAPFADLNADPQVMRFFPNLLDRAASDALIEMIETRFDRQGFGFWALEVAATGTFIGFAGLNPLPDGVPGAGGVEVGWRLPRHAWHYGYATEAARAALGVAFDNMGLPEIWSMTAVLNKPSQAVMRRLGLTETTRFHHPRIPPGDPLRPQVAFYGARPA